MGVLLKLRGAFPHIFSAVAAKLLYMSDANTSLRCKNDTDHVYHVLIPLYERIVFLQVSVDLSITLACHISPRAAKGFG